MGTIARIRYNFKGRVQGVGFRYTAYYAATQFGLTGFVQNLDDGSVLMEVQGPPEAIKGMLARIKESRWIHIESSNPQKLKPDPDERSFRVKSGW